MGAYDCQIMHLHSISNLIFVLCCLLRYRQILNIRQALRSRDYCMNFFKDTQTDIWRRFWCHFAVNKLSSGNVLCSFCMKWTFVSLFFELLTTLYSPLLVRCNQSFVLTSFSASKEPYPLFWWSYWTLDVWPPLTTISSDVTWAWNIFWTCGTGSHPIFVLINLLLSAVPT